MDSFDEDAAEAGSALANMIGAVLLCVVPALVAAALLVVGGIERATFFLAAPFMVASLSSLLYAALGVATSWRRTLAHGVIAAVGCLGILAV